jgi:hypothetical protein
MRIPPPEKPLSGLDAWRFAFGECIGFSTAAQNVVQAAVRVETYRELLRTALALKRHRLRHGTFPEKLDALVPEFLQAEPHDWMDGQPLKYRKREDGSYLLYSVGLDGIDDGGDSRPEKPKKRPQFGNGRDIVWPLLATASP